MLSNSGKSRHPCSVPDLRGNTFTVEDDVSCGIVIYNLYYIEIRIPSQPTLMRVFYHEWMLHSVKYFSCIYWDNYMIFILQFVNLVYHVDWFPDIESSWQSVQFSSVTQSWPTLCDPINHSTPGLAVHHQLPEFTQTHVLWVSDAIQPSHPLSSPFSPAPKPSQHQGLL